MFEEKILKGALNMVAPDAELSGNKSCTQYYHLTLNSLGKGTILISSDPDERDEQMLSKPLAEFCQDGAMLRFD